MAAEPLPNSRVILEDLFDTCARCLSLVDRAAQSDKRRAKLMFRFADNEISFDELQQHGKSLAAAAEAARNEYVPQIESLWRYCDRALVAKARYLLSFGGGAAAEGYTRLDTNPYFANMIAAGYAMAARGQLMHVNLLRKLREELTLAIDQLVTNEPEKPVWKSTTGKLMLRNKVIRNVRGRNIAGRLHTILDSFQAADWPDRISAPPKYDPQTLRETIQVLNQGLSGIKFRADGSGQGVIWEPCP